MPVALTPSGRIIVCDGCNAALEQVTDDMRHPLPPEQARRLYGKTEIEFVVCAPLPDGTQPCLELARVHEDLADQDRCLRAGCPTLGHCP
ncbi:hypothetical protein [Saccharothrix sp. HUAS TT1]|uniref:hypothetical protein n=1 Tax=unclassified Saccharothrix TaxID=2593673 RepID=UPI00345BCE05